MIKLTEISKKTEITKAVCPHCNKYIHTVGFMKGSQCSGITTVCKYCGRVYEVTATKN